MHARDIMEPIQASASPDETLRTAARRMNAAPRPGESGTGVQGMLEAMTRRVADRPVRQIMERDVPTVREDAPLMECAGLVVERRLQRVPVVDAGGKPVGMVYAQDLYHVVARALHQEGGDGA